MATSLSLIIGVLLHTLRKTNTSHIVQTGHLHWTVYPPSLTKWGELWMAMSFEGTHL